MTIARILKNEKHIIDIKKVYAWCIVPYDSLKRSAGDRIRMLKRLGVEKYAYDWREEHLSYMAQELKLAKQNDIEIVGIWMWIDENYDSIDALSSSNIKLFKILEEVDYQGQIWVSFDANFFENLSDSEAVNKGSKMVADLCKKANDISCKIALYNHGGWFGQPINQIKIINTLPGQDIGIVYNFHHAHKHIDTFSEMATMMVPYLWNVNLNGLKKEGPKILTIGKGDYEKRMINLLIEKGYKGAFGILGHVEDADVEKILMANLNGLNK